MRNIGIVTVVGSIVLGALLVGFWYGGWTKKDIKKLSETAQEKIGEMKESAEAAVHAATT